MNDMGGTSEPYETIEIDCRAGVNDKLEVRFYDGDRELDTVIMFVGKCDDRIDTIILTSDEEKITELRDALSGHLERINHVE